jgi:hypothetical protein
MLVTRSDGSECVKVLDFGISKTLAAAGSPTMPAMTQTAAAIGSPLYMSPEQMMSARDVDARTDLWALGTILFELLAGEPPFTAETLQALCVVIATAAPASLRARRSDVPPELEAVVLRCLQKTPSARFQDVAELARALTPFAPERARMSIDRAARILHRASGAGPVSRASSPAASEIVPVSGGAARARESAPTWPASPTSTVLAHQTQSEWGHTASAPSRRSPAVAIVAGAVLAAVVTGALFLALGAKSGAPVAASAAQVSDPAASHASGPVAPPGPPSVVAAPSPVPLAAPEGAAVERSAPAVAPAVPSTPSIAASSRTHEEATPPTPRPSPTSGAHAASPRPPSSASQAPKGSAYDDM